MLELDNVQRLMDDLWESTSANVKLSDSLKQELFAVSRTAPHYYDNRRSYHRYALQAKTVLKRGDSMFGAYLRDLLRQGVGFLSPVSLLPKERLVLRMPVAELQIEITRCRRLEPTCFECGARFVL